MKRLVVGAAGGSAVAGLLAGAWMGPPMTAEHYLSRALLMALGAVAGTLVAGLSMSLHRE